MLDMDAMTGLASEFWNCALLMYRTILIQAESKRRKAIADTQDSSEKYRKVHISSTTVPHVSSTESQSMTVADLSSNMCNCDPSEMKRVFDLFDENKDGRISAEELQLFMRRLGFELPDQKVKDMVRAVDRNSDDCVDFDEFFSLYSSLCGMEEDCNSPDCTSAEKDHDEEGSLLQAFFVFDENKDGLISAIELQQVLQRLGLPEGKSLMCCQKMIERVDADGNGKVDFFEFKALMCSDEFNSKLSKK